MKRTEPVRLREKKLSNGGSSLYLDIYVGGKRHYEFLKLYLVPARTRADKDANRQTMMLAEAVKAKRVIEVQNGRFGFDVPRHKKDASFTAYMTDKLSKMGEHTSVSWRTALHALQKYHGADDIMFSEVTSEWLNGFSAWLNERPAYSRGSMKTNTVALYVTKIVACLHLAEKEGLVSPEVAKGVKRVRIEDTERAFLTIEELQRLMVAECYDKDVRRTFLFACLTGLRISDVGALTWERVQSIDGRTRLVFHQKKTGALEYYDINEQAAGLMGEPSTGKVFNMPSEFTMRNALRKWVGEAGISKHITFHSARHTFAVLMLDLGVDIYTVSKLLGHHKLETTQVYAKVLDRNKRAAVDKFPDFLNLKK